MIRNLTSLRPPMTAPLSVDGDLDKLASDLNLRLRNWPALQVQNGLAITSISSMRYITFSSHLLSSRYLTAHMAQWFIDILCDPPII